jgi:hypothetical protein
MNKQEWDINTCRYWDMEIGCVRDVCRCEQEEPKQRLEKYSERFDNKENELVEGVFNPDTWGKRIIEEPKQDTLEEAKNNAWDNYEYVEGNLYSTSFKNGFEQGAKSDAAKEYWFNKFQEQDKNKYSEDEVLEQLNILMSLPSSTLDKFTDDNGNITMKWFEQIKKK